MRKKVEGFVCCLADTSEARATLRQSQEEMFDALADVIASPTAKTPLRQDDALIEARLSKIRATLTEAQLKELDRAIEPDVNKIVCCEAFLKMCKESIKLPDNEAVQVFRHLGQIPEDDRVTK